jgi:hypothetical protein
MLIKRDLKRTGHDLWGWLLDIKNHYLFSLKREYFKKEEM